MYALQVSALLPHAHLVDRDIDAPLTIATPNAMAGSGERGQTMREMAALQGFRGVVVDVKVGRQRQMHNNLMPSPAGTYHSGPHALATWAASLPQLPTTVNFITTFI